MPSAPNKPNALDWPEWHRITKKIYRLPGWPRAEMLTYYQQGMSPLHAVEKAEGRRRPTPEQERKRLSLYGR